MGLLSGNRGSLLLVAVLSCSAAVQGEDKSAGVFAKDNLVAWCIVPFDAKQRGPAERAEMLVRLGLKKVAYDWRQQHVPTFEEEILQYKKHELDFFAFWSWHDSMEALIRKHDIHPQIWMMLPNPKVESQEEKVKLAAEAMLPLVEKTKALGCGLGLYNHGGWGGEPENLVAVTAYLKEHHNAKHVGIVYNFHHGHEHIADFARQFDSMKAHLLCLNINGMDDASVVAAGKNKIVPVGSGRHEKQMLQTVKASGYDGPIGVLDHRSSLDAEESLKQNLDGLERLVGDGL